MIKRGIFFFFFSGVFLLFIMGSGLRLGYASSQRPSPIRTLLTIQNTSAVRVFIRAGEPVSQNAMTGALTLLNGTRPAQNLAVRVDTLNLREISPGVYTGQVNGITASPKKAIEVIIVLKPRVHFKTTEKPPEPIATARGQLTDIVEITSPARLETIDLAAARTLTIRWRFVPGTGPISRVSIIEGSGGISIFEQLNVPGDHLDINTSIFRAGRQYSIYLIKNNPNFVLAGHASSSSGIRLEYQTSVLINTL